MAQAPQKPTVNQQYMLDHGIPRLMDDMLKNVLVTKPDNAIDFLSSYLANLKAELKQPVGLYYHPFSAPSRSVLWFLKFAKVPYKEIFVDLSKAENKSKDFTTKVNPFGVVPAIVDGDFRLSEACAILPYLCGRYRVEKFYPANLQERAKVDRMLHWHHTKLRLATTAVVFPALQAFIKQDPDPLGKGDWAKVEPAIKYLESALSVNEHICGDDLSIYDFIAMCELDQLHWSDYLDWDKYPNIKRFMLNMAKLEGYDQVCVPKAQWRDKITKLKKL